jgi:hypothetical protein
MARTNGYAPLDGNPYAPYAAALQARYGQGQYTNPYARWQYWRPVTDETQRTYYTKNPDEAELLFAQGFGGSAGGNLEDFIRHQAQLQRAEYIRQNMDKPDLARSDTLTPELAAHYWDQWQSQTPYQRGENANLFAGAGRRT